jgi:hypothetical protein
VIVYATEDQLTTWYGSEPDVDSVGKYLRSASVLVHRACRNDLYDVEANGTPSDPDLSDAMSEAVCAQAEAWIDNGIDPVKGAAGVEAEVTKSSIDGASIELDATAIAASASAKAAAVNELCDLSVSILRAAGLASAVVRGY